ncbi:Uncharacterized protein PHSC3_002068 [Chlamydiales bacterium STE3]|nr:Uncharacterized protein PHSC3_002068 [Chlamydiales bacterium STE3]
MTIERPFEEDKRLKAVVAFMGVTLKNLVISCLKEHLLRDNELNDETLRAFKETDQEKELVRCKDFNNFVNKLGPK